MDIVKIISIINKSSEIPIIILIIIVILLCAHNFFLYKSLSEQHNRYIEINNLNNWISLCQNKILIRGTLNSSENPKITALITIYNSQNFIHTAVRSVQNQLFSDIEILIVDDGSTDNSSVVIQNLQNEDKRIKIIKNKRNRGALYAKSIGILKALGTFTMILDSDDLFANENIFNICFDEASKNNIDIIEFSGYNLNSSFFELDSIPEVPYYLRFKKPNEFIFQPDLSYFIYKKVGENELKLIDGVLWGKCIKSSIFKMTLKIVNHKIYRQKINYGDDRIINFILFKVAKSFKYIQEYGIIYNYNNNSITHLNSYINHCHDELINIMSIYNYTKNSKDVDIVAFEINFRWKSIIFPGMNSQNFWNLKKLINKLLSNKYLVYANRIKLIYLYHNLTESRRLNLFNMSL